MDGRRPISELAKFRPLDGIFPSWTMDGRSPIPELAKFRPVDGIHSVLDGIHSVLDGIDSVLDGMIPSWTGFHRPWTELYRPWTEFHRPWTEFGRGWTEFEWNWTELGRKWTEFGRNWTEFGRNWKEFGRDQFRPKRKNSVQCPNSVQRIPSIVHGRNLRRPTPSMDGIFSVRTMDGRSLILAGKSNSVQARNASVRTLPATVRYGPVGRSAGMERPQVFRTASHAERIGRFPIRPVPVPDRQCTPRNVHYRTLMWVPTCPHVRHESGTSISQQMRATSGPPIRHV